MKIGTVVLYLIYSIPLVSSAGGTAFNYDQNGADWPGQFELCGGLNQSPIDLQKDGFENEQISKKDDFVTHYENLGQSLVNWIDGAQTIKVQIQPQDEYPSRQFLQSSHVTSSNGDQVKFNANQFHFHSYSEHTIEGTRFDLEMHVVHFPNTDKTNAVASAYGILFDTEKYDKDVTDEQRQVIDKFFTQLSFGADSPQVNEIAFGQLMAVVGSANRWVYKGSLTTPPCTAVVHWNVVSKVYPIKPIHVELFRERLRGHSTSQSANGNYRIIQKVDRHDVQLIRSRKSDDKDGLLSDGPEVTDVLFICLLFFVVIVLGLSVYTCFKYREKQIFEEQQYKEMELKKYQMDISQTSGFSAGDVSQVQGTYSAPLASDQGHRRESMKKATNPEAKMDLYKTAGNTKDRYHESNSNQEINASNSKNSVADTPIVVAENQNVIELGQNINASSSKGQFFNLKEERDEESFGMNQNRNTQNRYQRKNF